MSETAALLRDLVEQRARTSPDVLAVGRNDAGWLTLGQLDRVAGRLARDLAAQGVGPGDVVGLLLPRSPEFVVAAFAAWKTGAAYTPVDPAAPEHHRAFVLDNSDVKAVVTADEAAGRATGRPWCLVGDGRRPADGVGGGTAGAEAFTSVPLAPQDPAWVLYTSGSTGRPKGVVGSHGATLNRCTWMWEAQPFASSDVSVQNTAPSVVDSLWEVWGSLAQGIPVVLPPAHASLDLDLLVQLLAEHRVTRICLVPSLLRALLTSFPDLGARLPVLEIWTCSGETLDRDLAQLFRTALPGRTLLNQYGLTESSADVTTYDTRDLLTDEDAAGEARVPIGRPIRGTRVLVVDEDLRPVPDGVAGELLLAGPSLANGYANAPELTADRFLPGHPATGTTVFRTGDLARLDPDGTLHHLGRRDRQVKIRGFRVEPEGVEAVLKECAGVRDAAVRVWVRAGESELAAYVVPETPGTPPDAGELRARMLRDLPSHALPSTFTVLAEFPRTASGKTDHGLLPEPARPGTRSGAVAPRDEVEKTVERIWREVLRERDFSVLDDFYERGGHSLALMRVIARVNAAYGVRLRRADFARAVTVESLARAVDRAAAEPDAPDATEQAPTTTGGVGVDLASETQAAMWLHEKCTPAPGLYNIQLAFRIRGALDVEALARALHDVVAAHRALRIGFEHKNGALRLTETRPALSRVELATVQTDEELVPGHLGDEGARPFDLASGPLLRALLLDVGDTGHVLSLTVHHTVCDGQSLRPLLASLSTAYAARSQGAAPHAAVSRTPVAAPEPATHAPPPHRYPTAQLPTDHPRPKRADGHGATLRVDVPDDLAVRVRGRARRLRTTPFTLCCAAFADVVASWTDQRRFAVSIPVANRGDEVSDDVLGCFMRTVALHVEIEQGARAPELLDGIRGALERAYEAPSVTRVEVGGRPPQLMLAYDEAHGAAFSLLGTDVTPLHVESRVSKLDLTLYLDESDDDYDCRIEYATALFEESTVRRFGREFLAALTRMCGEESDAGQNAKNEF
ncbi:amino acid adenylation domain-containing protein [Streptomyces sp. NPDC091682]|uniref:amino acid adenylation domain-containing protein n=1 Tax=Streptomyces sp. NPDC091682 TaxID=3366005 RepID=UPI00380E7649